MKKNYCIYLLVMTLAVVMCACSHDESSITDKLEQYIPNDVDFVFAGDLEQLLEVTDSHTKSDGTVELSDYMQKLIASMPSSVRNDISDVLDAKGFEWSTAVCGVHLNGNQVQTLNIFSVKDESDFADFFVDKYQFKKDKKNGFVTLQGEDFSIVVRDYLAFFATNNDRSTTPDETIALINEWQKRAKDKKIDDWKCKYLDEGGVLSALFNFNNVCKKMQDEIDDADFWEQTRPKNVLLNSLLPEARKLIVGTTFSINGLSASLKGKFFTQNGETYSLQHIDGKFNASLLKYATDSDVAAIGIANASSITSMIGQSITGFGSEKITQWLNNFDGSLMLALGVNTDDMKKIAEAPASNMHFVLAIDCKPGKAGKAIDAFAGMLQFTGDARVTKHTAGSELQFALATGTVENPALEPWEEGYYTSVYTNFVMKTDGDVLLLSNQAIDPTPVAAFTPDMFKNNYALAVLNLPADSNLMKALHGNVGADVRFSLDKSQFEAKITLSNTKKSFIEILVDIMQNA